MMIGKREGAMNSGNITRRGTIAFALISCLSGTGEVQAQTMDQYYAVPPFVSDQVAPNIILVLDNSGSMTDLGCDRTDDGDCVDAADLAFTNTTNWSGYFDSLRCYTYDTGADARFEPATVKV